MFLDKTSNTQKFDGNSIDSLGSGGIKGIGNARSFETFLAGLERE